MRNDGVPIGMVTALQVDYDGIHNEQREAGEEVEAEENNVGCGWGAEEEGEKVHPWNHGYTK